MFGLNYSILTLRLEHCLVFELFRISHNESQKDLKFLMTGASNCSDFLVEKLTVTDYHLRSNRGDGDIISFHADW